MTPQQIMAEHLQKKTEISVASRGGEEQKKLSAIHIRWANATIQIQEIRERKRENI